MNPTGTCKRSDLPWFLGTLLATILFGGFLVWLVLPRGALQW